MNNPYRSLWHQYKTEIKELQGSYAIFSEPKERQMAKFTIASLNYITTPFSFQNYGLPFEIKQNYSNFKMLETIEKIIFKSPNLDDYLKLNELIQKYLLEELNFDAKNDFVFDSLNVLDFSDIVDRELKEQRDNAVLELTDSEYGVVISDLSQTEKQAIVRIENARNEKFENIYFDLNDGDDDGNGDFFCCHLNKEPKYCIKPRFFCKALKSEFLEMLVSAEKFFY
ncbi:hypothetical protein [Campylobacter sp. JMF_03 NE3]|uniref:hypothetical protein n=1 Tax=Campylobacter sp. JMF_03 NE3 TaxID=2983831 RepID=UPI0022E9E4DF|nr:hypothetical protein [Campylobacter sp. JMF_03 NE3]MDA3053608.1 hypothetical protein [Campylobacter sp. JMF_03 NE3]